MVVVITFPLRVRLDAPSTTGPSQLTPVIGRNSCKSWNTPAISTTAGVGFLTVSCAISCDGEILEEPLYFQKLDTQFLKFVAYDWLISLILSFLPSVAVSAVPVVGKIDAPVEDLYFKSNGNVLSAGVRIFLSK